MKSLTIKKKIIGIVTLLLVFDLISYFLIYKNTKTSQKDAFTVDVAGRNRMLSQKMAALSGTSLSDDPEISSKAKSELKKTIGLFEKSVFTLKNGGVPPKTKLKFQLDPANEQTKTDIEALEDFFIGHKKLLLTIITEPKMISTFGAKSEINPSGKIKTINPKVKEAIHELQDRLLKGKMLKFAQKIVDDYTKINEEKQQNFYGILWVLFLVNLGLIGLTLLYFFKNISQPIEQLKTVSSSIAKGNFNQKIELKQQDEIGQVAENINQLIDNITTASNFADSIGQNKLDEEFEPLGDNDTLGISLLSMRTNLIQVADQEAKRNWINEGLAKFTEILRDTEDIERFYNNVLSNLNRYIGANQGYLYVINQEDRNEPFMEVKAVYAYGKQRYLEEKKEIHFKEGLVGQAWFDKEPLFFTEIPNDYVNITSGMGEATPRCIFIMPLIVNENVVGAIELASFKPLEEHVTEFISKIAESIAGAISNVKVNERTKVLLELSQQQTEEMRAQEEEMRQNMEEMQATTAEMERVQRQMSLEKKRIEDEFEAQLNIINSIAIVSKTDVQGNITYVNDEFLRWSKYSREEVMGKNHRMLKSGDQDDQIFVDMWKTISSGKIFRGEIKNKAKDGSFYWVDAIVAPVLDGQGKPKEYIAQRFVINEQKEREEKLNELLNKNK
jgi:PAS domain S-box-containing protein